MVVGALTASGTVVGMLFWLALVRPDALLGLLSDTADVAWFEEHPATLRALRVAGAVAVLVAGFVTGLAVAFLSGTS